MRVWVLLRIFHKILIGTALFLLAPLVVSLIHQESLWHAYAIPAFAAIALSLILRRLSDGKSAENLRRREGFFAVSGSWLIISLVIAAAFEISGVFASFAKCFFESISGFTTTGASIATDIEALPPSINFTRCFSQWFGGMGIIVLGVAILPELGVGGMQLFSAESSGISADKLAPRVQDTARALWRVYAGMTVVLALLLWAGGMPLYEGFLHSFTTVATGGFSNKNASIAAYGSLYIESLLNLFMLLSAINFALHYQAFVRRQPKSLWRSPEARLYLTLTGGAILLVGADLYLSEIAGSFGEALRMSSFNVISVASTTGFATEDFNVWPSFSKTLLIILMLLGGCAGSTAGGLKQIRIYVIWRQSLVQLKKALYPRLVSPIKVGEQAISTDTLMDILGFLMVFFLTALTATLVLTINGLDIISAFTSVISCMNSVGPGLGVTGPVSNYASLPPSDLYALSACMLLGRLEIITLLVIFTPKFWKR